MFDKNIADQDEKEFDLMEKSNFNNIFESVKGELLTQFKAHYHPQTRYDVQEDCKKFLGSFVKKNYEDFLPLKKFCFEHGENYAKLLKGGSLLLRDYYLSEHPELKI